MHTHNVIPSSRSRVTLPREVRLALPSHCHTQTRPPPPSCTSSGPFWSPSKKEKHMHASSTHAHTHTRSHHAFFVSFIRKNKHTDTRVKEQEKDKVTRKNQMLNCPKIRKKVSVVKKKEREITKGLIKSARRFFLLSALIVSAPRSSSRRS